MPDLSTIAGNFDAVSALIRTAEQNAGRPRNAATLIAVTKTQGEAALIAALKSGHRVFGENKVQEAQDHWADLKKIHPDIVLHLIGSLQTNKVKDAVALFDCIETLDREKLAIVLGEEIKKQGRALSCFIQVNTGEESQKAGIAPKDLKKFLAFCREDCGMSVTGLMCIPPVEEPSGLHFALLKKLAQENGLKELSMGMSGDFQKGIGLGATYVRIGTALFGERAKL
jgi:pyridoxal phosphate enzyme (YggS family)